MQVGSDREFRTVASEDLAGLLVYPDGAREVVSRDGWRITVEPTLWAKGPEAASSLDTLVPAELHIPMSPRGADEVPAPLSLKRRLRILSSDGGVRRDLVWAWLVFCLAVVAVGVATFKVTPWWAARSAPCAPGCHWPPREGTSSAAPRLAGVLSTGSPKRRMFWIDTPASLGAADDVPSGGGQ